MNTLHIINPASGKGKHIDSVLARLKGEGTSYYVTKSRGDAENYIRQICLESPDTHFVVYGGDGTLCEAVNGIMSADAGKSALLSVVPSGSGNDFVKSASFPEPQTIDLIRCNGRYSANMLNIGLDCAVAAEAARLKKLPLVSGTMSYILGLIKILIKKPVMKTRIRVTNADGTVDVLEGEFLLVAVANGEYCGGGFRAAPVAKLSDGVLDAVIVRNTTMRRILPLLLKYKKGTHINPETEKVYDAHRDILDYRKCTAIELQEISTGIICADGEIEQSDTLSAEIIPGALNYAVWG